MENQPSLDEFDKVFGPQSTERVTPGKVSPVSPLPPVEVRELRESSLGKASF